MRIAAVFAVAVCVTGSAGAAAPWRTVAVPRDGFSIAVPGTWHVVPRSTPRLEALIAGLRKRKQTALALQFAQIAAVRRATHAVYRFQAFAWPPPKGAVVPDVTVKIDPLKAGTTRAALPRLARRIANALSRSAGATAAAPVARTLPAGRAMTVTGTTRISKSLRSRYALYLLIHGRKLYSIAFRGPATEAESDVVRRFRFS
jgi:hypothetical protein